MQTNRGATAFLDSLKMTPLFSGEIDNFPPLCQIKFAILILHEIIFV